VGILEVKTDVISPHDLKVTAFFKEKIPFIPLTIAAMAHLPLNKDPVLIYQKRTNISAYLPLP
jgi:hypothetical protein